MIFLRHPLTDAPEGMCYGRFDVGLAPIATEQIADALHALPRTTELVSSPASRCRILAERIGQRDQVSIRFDERLQEYDFGEWEGQFWDAIPRTISERWMEDLWNNPPPGGERYCDLVARVEAALAQVSETATVICHAGVIRAAIMLRQNRSFDDVFAKKIPFCTPIHLSLENA